VNLVDSHGIAAPIDTINQTPCIIFPPGSIIAAKINYPDITNIVYGQGSQLPDQPLAVQIEIWLVDRYGLETQAGMVLPVFVHSLP
jgi:hypothetical protein